jgi:predicted dehydrogenase
MADGLLAASQTVETALKTGQIGQPVAVRLIVHLTADHGRIEYVSARALGMACRWLNAEPDRLTARGGVHVGHISILARLVNGASLLVSSGSSGVGQPLLKILVFGNRGVLSYEADGAEQALTEEAHALSESEQLLLQRVRGVLEQATGDTKTAGVTKSHAASPPRRKSRQPPHGLLLVAGDHTHQPDYAQALIADQRCRLVGMTDEADVSAHRRRFNEQLARRLGIPVLPDLEEALARADVHIVSICAEPIRRGRIAVRAAQAGKHLYFDKPLAGSLADADAIAAAARTAGTVDHMFSMVHTEPAQRVRELVSSGVLGELIALHFDLCFAKGPAGTANLAQPRQEIPVPERFELADSKRELTNVGVYPLVMLLSLLDRPVNSVFATTGNYFFTEHQTNGMEDFGQMLLELDGGVVATISAGRIGWRSYPIGGLSRVYLIGRKQCAVVDAHRPRVEVWANVSPWMPPARNPDDPMGMWTALPGSPFEPAPRQDWITPPLTQHTDAEYFLDCIEQGRASVVTTEIAAAATEILMAAYQSAATGKTITLPLPRP